MSEKMSASTNALNWFEISVSDMDRAKKFYEQIFDIKMEKMEMMGMTMAMFPAAANNGGVGGALVKSDMHQPATTGAVIYLNANPDLQIVTDKIEKAGGKVVMHKMLIDEQTGCMAFFTDTEGNKVGLHSTK
jgi:uncharacterized protein